MITRIVRLSIAPEHKSYFLELFRETYSQIRAFNGCRHLELFEESGDSDVLITLSKWESEKDLDKYRSSDLFVTTWGKVKPLFNAPPEAFSMERIYPVNAQD